MFHRDRTTSASRWVLIVALVVLAFPAAVAAHSELETSTPANGASVPSPFTGPIVLHFSAILATGSKASLLDSAGATIAAATVDGPGATMTFVLDAALAAGQYEVKWTTVAEDTDVARGTIGFTVAPASPTASPTAAATPTPSAAPTATAAASPTASQSPVPANSAPSATPGASTPVGGDASGGGGDVVLPILFALIVVGAGAAYLLSRRSRQPPAA
jgi:copper resistance protein C